MRHVIFGLAAALAVTASAAAAEDLNQLSDQALMKIFNETVVAENKVMMPMRDGVGLSTEIYRPKKARGKLPTIFDRTPYLIRDISESRSTLITVIRAAQHGYAYIIQNERGRYFSEGKFEILGYPQTDGYDALTWIAKQPWSNGKVGTRGCSSSAEWQLALAAQNHPAHAAMVPMAAGAGIGRVKPFYEQGNWYTGGAPRVLFSVWLYNVENPVRPQLPSGLDPAIRARVAGYDDLRPSKPAVNWVERIEHLPLSDLITGLGEPPGTYDQFIARKPDDADWYKGGLYHDNEGWGVPSLWFNSWYDVSIGPNMALFNHARAVNSDREASANQYVVVGPNVHCRFSGLGPDTVVGERNMGDATFDVDGEVMAWFDKWLKGDKRAFSARTPHVRYYTMGANKWKSDSQWPPKAAKPTRLYFQSGGAANSLHGDGRLEFEPPQGDQPADEFIYDPLNPVQTIGGGDCCNGGLVVPGARDQRPVEVRNDVLVYTSEPLTEPLEVSGFVQPVIYVSSDAKDTDFAVKLVDVAPDGTAYIIGDTILRARYREGYDREVMMSEGEVYKLAPTPITTSIQFGKGHRVRVEVTSSNFPKFFRNLNTGGDNVTESDPVIAKNAVHHSGGHASYIEFPVVR